MSAGAEAIGGSCLCGGVRLEVRRPLLAMGNCHCAICRRQHGTAYSTYAQAEADSLAVLEGADLIRAFRASDSAERQFCGRCGSKLFYRADAMPQFVWVAAGVFDDDPRVRSSHHIFVGSKAAWFDITDDLPQHDAFPDDAAH